MTNGKQLIVLSGGGHKGVVKLAHLTGIAKGSCSLDFRPSGATLYLVGDNIAQTELYDINSTFEVPFLSNDSVSCLVRTSSVTMFGGGMPRGELVKRVDEYLKRRRLENEQRGSFLEENFSSPQATSPAAPSLNSEQNAPRSEQTQSESAHRSEQTQDKICPSSKYDDAQISSSCDGDGCAQGTRSDDAPERFLRDWTRFDGNNFYYAVRPQLDEMFVRYPSDELLTATVQNSRWARVDAPDGAYSVGVLYDGEEPSFICYAVPETRSNRRPPAQIEDMCVWLPATSPDLIGYWVIYQSAKTGEIVK